MTRFANSPLSIVNCLPSLPRKDNENSFEPINAFVADFIGESSVYTGTVLSENKIKFLGANFNSDPADEGKFELNEKVDVVIRPEDVVIKEEGSGVVNATIVSKIFKGMHFEYILMVGKNELIAQSTKEYEEGITVGIYVEPENIQIMKKPFTSNFYDGFITKDYKISFADCEFEYDILPLFPGCRLNEEGAILNEKGDEVDVEDLPVTIEIGFENLELSDNEDASDIHGEIIQMIYKGDHYQVLVRTDDEEDFIVDTPDLWNTGDHVAVIVKEGGMNVKLRGGRQNGNRF